MRWPLHCSINHQAKVGRLVFQFKKIEYIVGPHIFECLTAFCSAELDSPDLSGDGVNLL